MYDKCGKLSFSNIVFNAQPQLFLRIQYIYSLSILQPIPIISEFEDNVYPSGWYIRISSCESRLEPVPSVSIFHSTAESGRSSTTADPRRKVAVRPADSTTCTSKLCPLCGLTLGSELCFNMHINLDTSTGYVTYECRICKCNNTHRRQMRTHLRVHTGEKPFSCSRCPYRTAQYASLKSHIANHEKGEIAGIWVALTHSMHKRYAYISKKIQTDRQTDCVWI